MSKFRYLWKYLQISKTKISRIWPPKRKIRSHPLVEGGYFFSNLLTHTSKVRRGVWHFNVQMIRKNQFMIESNHKLKHFQEAPDKKLGVQIDWLGREICLDANQKIKSFFIVMDFCKKFWDNFFLFFKNQKQPFSVPIMA